MSYFLFLESIFLFIIGVCLFLKKIRKNMWIGYRTTSSLSSEENWYHANYILGVSLMICGIVQVIFLVIGESYILQESFQALVAAGIPLLAILITALFYRPID